MSYFEEYYPHLRYPIASETSVGLRRAQRGGIHGIGLHFTLYTEPALIVMPTGSGKTGVLNIAPFQQQAQRVLVLTPSRLVRGQIAEELARLTTLKRIGVFDAHVPGPRVHEVRNHITSEAEWEALRAFDMVVAIPTTISPALAHVPAPPEDLFDLVLVDEAHHSPAKTWNTLLKGFPMAKRILFTATPFRRDRQEIEGRLAYAYPVREAYKDRVFGEIDYIPVPETGEDTDVIIARQAEAVFQADRAAGLDHCLMVRTDSKQRANQLKEIYAQHTGLNLQLVHSDHSYSHIQRALERLTNGELDGIICVDMLGEGFDFPRLKIAAIHAPHKSLEVTLQFIGRFARTNAANIGSAKFLAVPAAIEFETKRLYTEGAIWQEIVTDLTGGRIEQEVVIRESFQQFEPPDIAELETVDLSLYALRPYWHVKIYRVSEDVDIHAEISLPPPFSVVYSRRNPRLATALFITRALTKPRWSTLDFFGQVEHDLFIVYYHRETKLLFINASTRSEELYEHLARLFTSGRVRILPLNKINNVLVGLEQGQFYNIGMRNRMQSTNTESYRTITGRSAQKAITKSDGKLYHRGHLFGSALDGESAVTIGYSSASKVWSNTSSLIPSLISWCRKLAERIDTPKSVVTGSGLDHLIVGQTVSEIPADVIGAQWDHEAFRNPPVVLYFDKTGAPCRAHLLDLDLQILREQSDGKRIRVMITGPDLLCPVDFSLDTPELFTPVGPLLDIRVERGHSRLHLLDYLNLHPLMFYFADFSCLQGEEHFCFLSDGYLPLNPEQMEVVDWTAANVDITQECGPCSNGRLSIHEYLADELCRSDADVVFFDHGKGEIADFLSFKERAADLLIRFYHCKGSAEKKPGQRVEDVYEVCGQVVKSLCWLNTNQSLHEQIQRRARQKSIYIKGDKAALAALIEKSKTVPTVYEMVVVQPGIRSSSLEPRIAEVIAAANDYIRGHCQPLSLRVS